MDRCGGSRFLSLTGPDGTLANDAKYVEDVIANVASAAETIREKIVKLEEIERAASARAGGNVAQAHLILDAIRAGDIGRIPPPLIHANRSPYPEMMTLVSHLAAYAAAAEFAIASEQPFLPIFTPRDNAWSLKAIATNSEITKNLLTRTTQLSAHIALVIATIYGLRNLLPDNIAVKVADSIVNLRSAQNDIDAITRALQPYAAAVVTKIARFASLATGTSGMIPAAAIHGIGKAALFLEERLDRKLLESVASRTQEGALSVLAVLANEAIGENVPTALASAAAAIYCATNGRLSLLDAVSFLHAAFVENEKALTKARRVLLLIVDANPECEPYLLEVAVQLAMETEIFAALFATVYPHFDSAGNAQCTCTSSKDGALLQRETVVAHTTCANAELAARNYAETTAIPKLRSCFTHWSKRHSVRRYWFPRPSRKPQLQYWLP